MPRPQRASSPLAMHTQHPLIALDGVRLELCQVVGHIDGILDDLDLLLQVRCHDHARIADEDQPVETAEKALSYLEKLFPRNNN